MMGSRRAFDKTEWPINCLDGSRFGRLWGGLGGRFGDSLMFLRFILETDRPVG